MDLSPSRLLRHFSLLAAVLVNAMVCTGATIAISFDEQAESRCMAGGVLERHAAYIVLQDCVGEMFGWELSLSKDNGLLVAYEQVNGSVVSAEPFPSLSVRYSDPISLDGSPYVLARLSLYALDKGRVMLAGHPRSFLGKGGQPVVMLGGASSYVEVARDRSAGHDGLTVGDLECGPAHEPPGRLVQGVAFWELEELANPLTLRIDPGFDSVSINGHPILEFRIAGPATADYLDKRVAGKKTNALLLAAIADLAQDAFSTQKPYASVLPDQYIKTRLSLRGECADMEDRIVAHLTGGGVIHFGAGWNAWPTVDDAARYAQEIRRLQEDVARVGVRRAVEIYVAAHGPLTDALRMSLPAEDP